MLRSFLVPGLLLLLWPLSFLLQNSFKDFLFFFFPSLLLLISFFLFKKRSRLWMVLLLAVVVFNFRGLYNNSIIEYNNDLRQEVIQKSYLYPNIWLPRIFQNKLSVHWDRFTFNFFALVDPNNYFFNFHPREILIDNQNLPKFPSLSIILFGIGLYNLSKNSDKKFLIITIPILIFNLSLLKNFDRYDFSLYVSLAIIILLGFNELRSYFKKFQKILLGGFLIFTITEYLHLIVGHFIK